MINKNEFTKIANNIIKSHKKIKSPELVHPKREWAIGLLVSVLIFAGTAWWSIQTYRSYQNTAVNFNVQEEEVVVYRKSLVESALEVFSTRAEEYGNLTSSPKTEPVFVEEVEVVETEFEPEQLEEELVSDIVDSEGNDLQPDFEEENLVPVLE